MDPAQVAQMLKTMIAVVVLALGGRIPDGLDVDTREAQEVMASLGTALGGAPQGKLAPGLS
jgi:NADPH-dependent glutamate synthase beta subunit-like oxidoreductase